MAQLFNNNTIGPSYAKQLQAEHSGSKWGSTGAKYSGNDVVTLLRERPYIRTVLDFGAGKGSLGLFIRQHFPEIEWTNYDPGIPEYDTLPTKRFDLVISTDVLEHVEPDSLPNVLATLEGLTGKVLFSDIACFLTGKLFGEGPYIGQDLHLIVEEPSWWREQFKAINLHEAEYKHYEKESKGVMKARCLMVHERT
jgi:hypothetical protein